MTESKPTKKAAKKAPSKKIAKKAAKKVPVKQVSEKKTPHSAPSPFKASSYENEFVSVKTEFGEGCKATFEVIAKEKVLNDSHLEALKEVSKNISIPGFRKGKVPKEIVEKNYRKYIEDQSEQIFVQKSIEQALILSQIKPLNYRDIKPSIKGKTQKEAQISFNFETYPIVPEIDLDGIKLKKVEAEEITQDKVDEVIDVMRSYRAKWERIEGRAVQKEDFVEVDIENLENNTKLVSKKRVHVRKGRLSSWIMKLIVGMEKGESKEGTSAWDNDMPQDEKKDFKPTKCKLTVLDILTAEMPEVDDEFAKAMGTQSVADLKTQVLLRLNKNAESVVEAKQREELEEKLEKSVDFDLPSSLIEAEKNTKIQLREQELKQANFSDEDIKKRKEEIESESLENAIKSLKLFFIMQKIAQDNGIIVSERELQSVLAERMSQLNLPAEFKSSPQFKNQIIPELRMNSFIEILNDKVKRYLLKKVTYS